MKRFTATKSKRGQSIVELAITIPFILMLIIGATEVVLAGRTYLALLEASVVSSRLASAGEVFYDNNEILTLTNQVLSQEGLAPNGLIDVIITRADLVDGTSVQNYQVANMLGSGQPSQISQAFLLDRINPGDPSVRVIGVEIVFNHHLLLKGARFLPDPLVLRALTLNAVP